MNSAPDCDYCGRYESGFRVFFDGFGNKLNLCPCCDELGGHSEECDCN